MVFPFSIRAIYTLILAAHLNWPEVNLLILIVGVALSSVIA